MASETVKAKWIAPFAASLSDGKELTPGVSIVDIPRGEAEASDNWQIISGKQTTKAGS